MSDRQEAEAATAEQLAAVLDDDPGPDSVADTLREAFLEGEGEGQDAAEGAGEQAADGQEEDDAGTPEAEGAAETAPAKTGDDGGEDGDDKDKSAAAGGGDQGKTGDDVPGAADGALSPPTDWSAEDHETFHAQSPEVKTWVLGKVKAYDDKLAEQAKATAEQTTRLEALDKVLGPRQQGFKIAGKTEAEQIETLFLLSDFAGQKPGEFIKWFAGNHQINLADLAGVPANGAGQQQTQPGQDQQGADDYQDPQVAALKQELAETKSQLAEITTGIQTREKQAADSAAQQEQQKIDAFALAADEGGQLKHPHFDTVRHLMASILSSGQAPDLETAYDMATRAHPEVSRKLDAAAKAKTAAEQAQKNREKAEAAKRAGSSVTGSPAGKGRRAPAETVADELRTVADELGAQLGA